MKTHREYAIINNKWWYQDHSLFNYMNSLVVEKNYYNVTGYAGICGFYIRDAYDLEYMNGDEHFDKDPWGRRFPTFPSESTHANELYTYRGYYSNLWPNDRLQNNVYVIVTTVNTSRVYCVDLLRNR